LNIYISDSAATGVKKIKKLKNLFFADFLKKDQKQGNS